MSDIQYGSLPLQYCARKHYFIGDVHNEADKLMNLLDQIEPIFTKDDRIVFLGDLIDRGTQAALLVDVLVTLNRKYPGQIFFVRGNHDWMLQHYLRSRKRDWFQYLLVTLEDFKTQWKLPDIEPDTIMKALIEHGYDEVTSNFLPYYETEEVIATHAPLDHTIVYMNGGEYYAEDFKGRRYEPGFEYLLDRMEYELLWQFTGEELDIECIDKFRVCGHQPPPGYRTDVRVFKDRAFVDSGCGKGNRPVSALVYPGKKVLQSR